MLPRPYTCFLDLGTDYLFRSRETCLSIINLGHEVDAHHYKFQQHGFRLYMWMVVFFTMNACSSKYSVHIIIFCLEA